MRSIGKQRKYQRRFLRRKRVARVSEPENFKERRHASMWLSGGGECVFVLYVELALLKGWTVVKKSLKSRKRILREH